MAVKDEQRQIIDRWVASLAQISGVDVVWLEGSLVGSRDAVPGADIDVRIGLADEAYDRLWLQDKSQLLAGLGNILRLIDAGWIRAITEEGVIVELAVRRSSELNGLELHEWELLLNRLPAGEPRFIKLPPMTPAESWPEEENCTPEFVRQQMAFVMTLLANAPAPFYNGELQSARFTADDFRITLIKLMYRYSGVWFAKRYKHFSEVLSTECLEDLKSTYLRTGVDPLDPQALAEATLQIYLVIGKYLERLAERYGGGFEPTWYSLVYDRTKEKMAKILNGAG